ncbi:MAG: hypothetical protein V1743_05290 [Nanoarchaeota archaeon]
MRKTIIRTVLAAGLVGIIAATPARAGSTWGEAGSSHDVQSPLMAYLVEDGLRMDGVERRAPDIGMEETRGKGWWTYVGNYEFNSGQERYFTIMERRISEYWDGRSMCWKTSDERRIEVKAKDGDTLEQYVKEIWPFMRTHVGRWFFQNPDATGSSPDEIYAGKMYTYTTVLEQVRDSRRAGMEIGN